MPRAQSLHESIARVVVDPSGFPYAAPAAGAVRQQAVVEFDPAGKVLSANAQFLVLMGYTLDTLRGQHRRIFLDVTEHDEQACRAFWEQLRRGEAFVGRCKRRTGAGQDARLGAVRQTMG